MGILAVALAIAAYLPYIREILAGRATPHPYSWLVWGFSGTLIAGLSFAYGGGFGVIPIVVVVILCFTVSLLGFFYGGRKNIKLKDSVFLLLSVLALIMWLFVQQPLISIILLVATDMLALIPSIRKVWKKPYSEPPALWITNGSRQLLVLLALEHYNLITMLGPASWIIANFGFAMLLLARRKVIPRPRGRQA